ncbi:transcriptional regulator [Thauera chlorobenzoica]|uniref:Transcriptional regulator n=2 Tax=Thauera chlorobenzoica TaxID=96773 RepID=A0A1L6F880_9RHOO|nr:transcriptional regulator [Thauera chlorobenzoica]
MEYDMKAKQQRTPPLLSDFAPFDLLEPPALERITASVRPIHAARGELLVQRDDRARGVHLVVDGDVKCFVLSPSGSEKIVRIAGSGAFFGEDAALLDRPHVVNAQAMRACELLLVPTAALRAAMDASHRFCTAMGLHLAAASHDLMSTLQLQLQLSSTQRVAHYLTRLAPEDAEHCEIHLETDKQTIAAQLNLTPETLSRVLAHFVREGLIRPRGRRGMVLSKLSQLRTCAAH